MRMKIVIVLKYFDGSVTFPRIWCYFACGMLAALFRVERVPGSGKGNFEVFVVYCKIFTIIITKEQLSF